MTFPKTLNIEIRNGSKDYPVINEIVSFNVPKGSLEGDYFKLQNTGFKAVSKKVSLGQFADVIDLEVTLAPNQVIKDTLVSVPEFPAEFKLSLGVSPSQNLIPLPVVYATNGAPNERPKAYQISPNNLVLSSKKRGPWCVEYKLEGEIPELGLFFEGFAEVYSDQAVINFRCNLVPSRGPGINCEVLGVGWLCDHFFSVDFNDLYGVKDPFVVGDKWLVTVVDSPLTLGEWRNQCMIEGRVLCLPFTLKTSISDRATLIDFLEKNHPEYVLNLKAAEQAPVGVSVSPVEWDFRWMGGGLRLQETPSTILNAKTNAERSWDTLNFRPRKSNENRAESDIFARRPRGHRPNTPDSGDSYPFGHGMGDELVTGGHPMAAYFWQSQQTGHLRPTMYFTGNRTTTLVDGLPIDMVTLETNEDFVTWSQHLHGIRFFPPGRQHDDSTSLGYWKEPGSGWYPKSEGHGWSGQDQQHQDSRTEQCVLALQYRRWRFEEAIRRIEVARVESFDDSSARALARSLRDVATDYWLTGYDKGLEVLERKLARVESALKDNTRQGPCVPINIYVDDRVLKDANGKAIPAMYIWQEAILGPVLRHCAIVCEKFGHTALATRFDDAAITVCKTVIDAGYVPDADTPEKFVSLDSIVWDDTGFNQVKAARTPDSVPGFYRSSGFFFWTNLGALLAYRSIVFQRNLHKGDPFYSKASKILIQAGRPRTWKDSKYIAIGTRSL